MQIGASYTASGESYLPRRVSERERERAILLVKLIAMAVDKARLSAANDPLREDYRSCGTTISPSPSRNTPRITLLLMLLLLQRRDRDVDGRTQLSHSDEILISYSRGAFHESPQPLVRARGV